MRTRSRSIRGLALLLALAQFAALLPAQSTEGRLEFDPILGLQQRSGDENPESGVVDVFSRLNVRSGPGTQYDIIGKLYPGEKLQILGTEDGWHKIKWNGQIAWCCAYYVNSKGEKWHNQSLADGGGSSGQQDDTGSPGGGGRGKQQPQTGGPLLNMPLINQNTGGGRYPGSYCGPTSVRMVLKYYGIDSTADQIALRSYGPGTPMYRPGQGSTHQGMASALKHFGLQTKLTYSRSLASLREAVSRGHPVIINLRGNYGPFFTNGHISPIVGFTSGGDPILNDSAGGVRRVIPAQRFLSTWNGLFLEVWK